MTARACIPPAGATATRCTSAISIPPIPASRCFDIQERFDAQGMSLRDARTGKPLFTIPSVKADESGGDKGEGPGRGVAFNIDPRFPGAESWAAGAGMSGMYDVHGKKFRRRPARAVYPPTSLSGGTATCCANCSTRTSSASGTGRRRSLDAAARRAPLHVQQRHQGDTSALGGYLGRLARRSDLAHARQPRAAHLHLDRSRRRIAS